MGQRRRPVHTPPPATEPVRGRSSGFVTADELEPLYVGSLAATAMRNEHAIEAAVSGIADARDDIHLLAWANRLHRVACDRGLGQVCVDLRELIEVTSPCFGVLLHLAKSSRAESSSRYRVVYLVNPFVAWQIRTVSQLYGAGADIIQMPR